MPLSHYYYCLLGAPILLTFCALIFVKCSLAGRRRRKGGVSSFSRLRVKETLLLRREESLEEDEGLSQVLCDPGGEVRKRPLEKIEGPPKEFLLAWRETPSKKIEDWLLSSLSQAEQLVAKVEIAGNDFLSESIRSLSKVSPALRRDAPANANNHNHPINFWGPAAFTDDHRLPVQYPKLPNSKVVIAVDATPKRVGGFCVLREEKTVWYYSAPMSTLPWRIERQGDSNEFEMKNLLAALLLFQELIERYGEVEVYTDNWGLTMEDNKFGGKVNEYLDHLEMCYGIRVVNKGDIHITRRRRREIFEACIDPADALSRGDTKTFYKYLNEVPPWRNFVIRPCALAEVRVEAERWSETKCQGCKFSLRDHTHFSLSSGGI